MSEGTATFSEILQSIGHEPYDLPDKWEEHSLSDRLDWHRNRVEQEEPIFNMLQKQGILSTFTSDEIKERLEYTRKLKKRVEAAILVAEIPEFQAAWHNINRLCVQGQEINSQRAAIQKLQFRRSNFKLTKSEETKMAELKHQANSTFDEAEQWEGTLMDLCEKYGADPTAYLIVDDIR